AASTTAPTSTVARQTSRRRRSPSGAAVPGPGAAEVLSSVVEDEGHLEHHLVGGDRAVGHLDLLLLHPGARDVAQRLRRTPDTGLDRVLEADVGACRDRGDTGDRAGHDDSLGWGRRR